MKFDKHAPVGAAPSAQAHAAPPAEDGPAATADEYQDLQNPAPAVQKAPGFAIPQFVYAIGFYLVISYLFQ